MSTVIRLESVGKKYQLRHKNTAHYTALRDAFSETLHRFGSQMLGGRRQGRITKEDFWALQDISFEVEQGERLGIIGRNGAGKSTLLKLLSRITAPSKGRILLKGRVGSLLEVGTGFHPELTGRENIFLNGAILGMSHVEICRKFDEIVAFAEIDKFLDTPVKRYSSGMYVRLAFAVAAHLESEILIVDEVLAVGDAAFQKKCLGKMGEAAREGRTVLFVSHNMVAVQRLCQKCHVLDGGKIVWSGDAVNAVENYLKIQNLERSTNNTAIRTVPGNGVGFTQWQLNNDKDNPHCCVSGDSCRFIFNLCANREIAEANFGFVMWDEAGTLIFAMRSIDYGRECFRLPKGTFELEFAVPSLPVKKGLYQIHVSANDKNEGTLDSWYAEPRLQVLAKDDPGLPIQFQGVLDIRSQFGIKTTSE